MATFHERIQMSPTPCQMQIINRHLPGVDRNDCAIRYEGGTHYNDGRDYDGWFCVDIYRIGRYKWSGKQFKKQSV